MRRCLQLYGQMTVHALAAPAIVTLSTKIVVVMTASLLPNLPNVLSFEQVWSCHLAEPKTFNSVLRTVPD